MAIVPALIVSCEEDTFAVPQVSLIELVRLDDDYFESDLENIRGATFYRLRGNLLPLVYLCEELKINMVRPQHRERKNGNSRVMNIVVVRADTQVFGLVVDDVHDTEEIVVKSLSKGIKSLGVYAGATIMGDGRVALILDVMNLAQRSQVIHDRIASQEEATTSVTTMANQYEIPLLIVELGNNEPAAIPLESVRRLEEFSFSKVEFLNGRSVVQYRGSILDLVDLRTVHGHTGQGSGGAGDDACQVIVLNDNDRQVGFMVRGIMDVVKHSIDTSRTAARHGSKGAAIIQNKIMDVLDLSMMAL